MDGTSLYRLKAGKSRLDGKLLVADTRKGVIDVLRVGTRMSSLDAPTIRVACL